MSRTRSLALAALAVSLGTGACNDEFRFAPDGSNDPATKELEPAPDLSGPKFDADYMTSMIDHHQVAVRMSEVCAVKAEHEALRKLCKEMITTQSVEVETMQGWLEDWYDITHEPVISKQDKKRLAELKAAEGAELEILFLELMIAHHSAAIDDGKECSKRAYHEELLEHCEGIVKVQTEESELMQGWLCEWYDRC